MKNTPTQIVSGLLLKNDQCLLCLRKNTGVFDGHWALPVGHREAGENEIDTLRRELFEELAIQLIDAMQLSRLFDNEKQIEHSVYQVLDWRGELVNNEPQLCAKVDWFCLNDLPSPLTPATAKVLKSLSLF